MLLYTETLKFIPLASAERRGVRPLGAPAVRVVRVPLAGHVAQLLQPDHLLLHERPLQGRIPADNAPRAGPASLLLLNPLLAERRRRTQLRSYR